MDGSTLIRFLIKFSSIMLNVWHCYGFSCISDGCKPHHGECGRALSSYDIDVVFWKRFVDDVRISLFIDKIQHFLSHLP